MSRSFTPDIKIGRFINDSHHIHFVALHDDCRIELCAMSSSIPEEYAGLFSVQSIILLPVSTLSVMYFVYGLYVLLFGTWVYMLRSRQNDNDRFNHKSNFIVMVALFVLTTMVIIDQTMVRVRDAIILFTAFRTGDYGPLNAYFISDVEKTATYVVADYILIHRCYLIWSSSKRVALPLIVASVVTNVLGLAGSIMLIIGVRDMAKESNLIIFVNGGNVTFAYNICSAVVNSALTLLTAGRIWWIHREVRAHGIHTTDTLVQSITRIILESGMLYPFFIVAALIVTNTVSINAWSFDVYPLVALSAGVAPTLIMVRAKLGKNVESLQNMVSDIHFMSQPEVGDAATARSRAQVHSIALEFERESEERAERQKEAV
ncbi:hypothetical protein WG66_005602 [Moniliophthora roreri]|nr:hypothetical protein WG66_005602 [Moniliophthora roreri]